MRAKEKLRHIKAKYLKIDMLQKANKKHIEDYRKNIEYLADEKSDIPFTIGADKAFDDRAKQIKDLEDELSVLSGIPAAMFGQKQK